MKIRLVPLVFFAVSSIAFAGTEPQPNFSAPYDVVVPALNGDPSGSDRQVGQVYIDVSSGGGTTGTVKAIGKDGSLLTISSGSVSSVGSGGTERIERARVFCSNSSPQILSQSGTWISTISPGGTAGTCSLNITTSVFSTGSTPTCVCSSEKNFATSCSLTGATTATSVSLGIRDNNSGASTNENVDIICMGPR